MHERPEDVDDEQVLQLLVTLDPPVRHDMASSEWSLSVDVASAVRV